MAAPLWLTQIFNRAFNPGSNTFAVSAPNPFEISATNPIPVTAPNALPVTAPNALLTKVDVATLATVTVSPIITTGSVLIIAANPNRKGLIMYNQSANSVYLSMMTPANASTTLFAIVPTFTQISLNQLLPNLRYTGPIYGIRNSGTGTVVCTELT